MTEAQYRVFVVGWTGGLSASYIPWAEGLGIISLAVLTFFTSKLAGWVAAGAKERKE